MKVTFCGNGAGGSYEHDRGGSCVMIEHQDRALLVDCGPGSVRRVAQAGVPYGSIAGILITHLHYDHALGLAELFNRFGRFGSDPPVILGPKGIDGYVEACKKLITVSTAADLLPPHLEKLAGEFASTDQPYEVAGSTATAIEVPHNSNVQAYSWRISNDDGTVVVSGDLKTDESFMVPFSAEADLLVHEAYTAEGLESLIANRPTEYARDKARTMFSPTHSEVSVVAKIARKAKVKRLALTHLVPQEDEQVMLEQASQHFDGEIMIATPSESLVIR